MNGENDYLTARDPRQALKIHPNTPQYPGQNLGMSDAQFKQFIRNQKKAKGFRTTIAAGANPTPIQLPGTSRLLLGLALVYSDTTFVNLPTDINLTLNNEVILDNIHPKFLMSDFMDDEYYYLPRPLSGQDSFQFNTNSEQPNIQQLILYYI